MSIPRDATEQQALNDELLQSETIIADDATLNDVPKEEEIELAASAKFASDAAKIITPKPKPKADLLTRPGQAEKIETTGEPVAIVSDKDIFVRKANANEMQAFETFRDADDLDLQVILPNLNKITTAANQGAATKLPPSVELSMDLKNLSNKDFEKKYEKTKSEYDTAEIEANPLVTADKELKRLIAATYNTYKDIVTVDNQRILRKGERGFKQVVADANRIGAHDIFIELMKRKPGDRPFTDAEVLAARRTVLSLGMEADRLLQLAMKTNNPVDKAKAAQAISLEGYALVQLVGNSEDIARTLGTHKIIASPSKKRVEAMRTMLSTEQAAKPNYSAVVDDNNAQSFIDAHGGEAAVDLFLMHYNRLPKDASRHQFAKRTVLRKGADMLVEIYQSALLSNPLTHAFNGASSIVHLELLALERLFEGRPQEALSMVTAQAKYVGQALRAGYYALKNEESVLDNTSRLDVDMRAVSRQGAGLMNFEEGAGLVEGTVANFFDGFGILMRMQGYRPMIAMDEFFKTLSRGAQLEALSVRAEQDARKVALKNGASKTDAEQAGVEAYIKTLGDENAFEQASEFARMVTFQDDVPGFMGAAQGFMSHPITKIWVPFYKTPTQVMRRIMERTPMGVLMPSVLRDKLMKGSNAERREAMARIGVSGGIAAATMSLAKGYYSDDFVITGYGPTNKKERSNWLQNNRPYSIGVFDESTNKWNWISYERYDPISGVLAAYVDTADTLMYADADMADEAVLNITLATMKYVTTSLPMMQFVGELMDVGGSAMESTEAKVIRIRELFAKQFGTAGLVVGQSVGSMGTLPSSMTATVERYLDPYSRDPRPDAQFNYVPGVGLQPEIRGLYESLNYMRSRIPGMSKELPVKYNRWFEPMFQGKTNIGDNGKLTGVLWQSFVPYKVKELPNANIINAELDKLGLGFNMLPRSMNEPMIRLSGKQYQRYIELFNYPERSEFINDIFKREKDIPQNVLGAFYDMINADDYNQVPDKFSDTGFRPTSKGEKAKLLQSVDSMYKGFAKKLMLLEYPELQALVRQRDTIKDSTGRNPSMLKPPSDKAVQFEKDLLMRELGVQLE